MWVKWRLVPKLPAIQLIRQLELQPTKEHKIAQYGDCNENAVIGRNYAGLAALSQPENDTDAVGTPSSKNRCGASF